MKIVFCLHHFLPEYIAGTEIYALRLAQYLKKAGIEVVILIPHFDQSTNSEYEYENLRVIRYGEQSISTRKIIMGSQKPAGLEAFGNILKEEKPDIIHFHELANGRGVSIFHVQKANQLGIPIVLTCHLSYYSCLRGSLIYKDQQKCDGEIQIKRCTDCLYQSKHITGLKAKGLLAAATILFKAGIDATKINSTLGTALGYPFIIKKLKADLLTLATITEKIVVLGDWYKDILVTNGVPVAKLICIKQGLTNEVLMPIKTSQATLPLKLVFIGRISALKGLHLLIAAINQLPLGQVSLDIFGPKTEDSYAAECENASLSNKNIQWKGTIASTDVIATLSKYDILCLPSTFSEMSPLVIQEAFAAGIPVLASDVHGNAAQIQDGVNGWLFKFKDSNSLANKLQLLVAAPALVEKARLHLPKANLFTEVAREHIALYVKIIDNPKTRLPENIISYHA